MKKKVKALGCIFLALCLTVLSGCQAVNPDREKSYDTATLGKFINCSSVTPSEAVTTINNQGMSGLRSSIHLHSDDASDAYISDHKPVLVYDLETVQRLGYLYIWNLNAEGMLDCGLKEIDVEYSVDGKSWTKLTKKPIVLAKASADENKEYAGNAANNQNDGKRTPIDFGGVNARYVRITALSNYGGSKYGLSEVRFFSYKVRPKNGSEIMAFSTAPNATEKSENIANGLNINGDKISDSADTSWSAPVGKKIKNNFIFIDLDGSYPVEKVRIYNYNVK